MGAIEVRGLLVERGGQTVLHGLDLTVPAAQITGLLGPSGCGKSTLMRAIVGVQIVAGGDVRVLGEPAGSPQVRERVGYVTQAPAVYGDLTVRENLGYFGRVLGAPPGRDRASMPIAKLDLPGGYALAFGGLALPLTYAFDALDRLAEDGSLGGRGWFDVAMVVGMTILALVLGALTLRRRTP